MQTTWQKTVLVAATLAMAACGSSSSNPTPDSGVQNINPTFNLPFTPTTSVPRQIQVLYSGETLGDVGLPYPSSCPTGNDAPPFFVDGWSVFIDEYLVVVGNIRLTPNAAQFPQENLLNSPPVATKAGPYVFDGHKGIQGFVSTDGVSPAGPIFAWNQQDNGQAFSTTEQYAFSYDIVAASYPVTQVNLTSAQFADYDLMVQRGWSKYVKGHAVFAGTTGAGTYPPNASVAAKFNALQSPIYFTFGWNDSGGVLNCNNPELGFTGEDQPSTRGIKPSPTGSVPAQVTLHVDHIFWDTQLQEGTPLRFDQVAGWAVPPLGTQAQPIAINTLNKLTGTLAATFADGTPMPDRGLYQPASPGCYDQSNQSNPAQLTLNLNGVPAANIHNLADFMAFSAQAQMHMNADGLCYEVGQHAPDPWYLPGLPTP